MQNFNPRSPHGERLVSSHKLDVVNQFQPTLPARGATAPNDVSLRRWQISTHAPRTGSDVKIIHDDFVTYKFQPTLPARGATKHCKPKCGSLIFQPTLPARGATLAVPAQKRVVLISTHAPRTGSDNAGIRQWQIASISTHAPRTGSDTASDRGRCLPAISTHAPRTGSDALAAATIEEETDFNPRSPHGERRHYRRRISNRKYFNPRSPHGERPFCSLMARKALAFQPTLPARGATRRRPAGCRPSYFNPRSPHGERQATLRLTQTSLNDFNPRSPHGERQLLRQNGVAIGEFQPTLPARGATAWTYRKSPQAR